MHMPVDNVKILQPSAQELAMFKWARNQGIRWPKIIYPVLFPPGYIGSMAASEIFPGDTIISGPNSCLLTTKVAKSSPLNEIFESNPECFNNSSSSTLILLTFILYEKSKGRNSPWHAFIASQPNSPSNLQDWSAEELTELQDADMQYDIQMTKEYFAGVWQIWKSTMMKYHLILNESQLSLEEFTWALRIVGTRTFGKFVPYLTLFPVGELLNHENVKSFYSYLRKDEIADCSRRYGGIEDDEDCDGWIYEIHEGYELNSYSLNMINYLINGSKDNKVYESLQARAKRIDKKIKKLEELNQKCRNKEKDLTESTENELRISAGPDEHYAKGAEVYMSYGRYSNRQLLSVYGFSLKNNRFNFAILKFQLSSILSKKKLKKIVIEDLNTEMHLKFKLKELILCEKFVSTLRKLFWKADFPQDSFFEAKSIDLERKTLAKCLEILIIHLQSFPTTVEEDKRILNESLPIRKYFALLYRSQVKEIIVNQIEYCETALDVLEKVDATKGKRSFIKKKLTIAQTKAYRNRSNPEKVQHALEAYFHELKSNIC